MMWGNTMGWGWGWGGGGLFVLIHMLWWALVIVGIVVLVRWVSFAGGRSRHFGEDRALSILRERYARGEIDKAEFDARKKDLG